ncbi:phosphocholine cytidylyltransferase family protein [Mucilaginibacter boryungensis]|uniref:Phosphocholine cytidylyltransferase family protein n=1 Tax=Mucilaginibacter boryungensis TaxID=768480 RepID=A0ABR9XKZ3_9SPHI|nr:phosphocholine cytidylyltransferase family protein [Mucilaginibacter boryungensis]MBE9667890.1 phosphocholine cytidylyltransferase family protein [Mucilaginibacter boryungensis]
MIGVIMAAGKGSRLGNHTTDLPKSLLKLNDSGTLLDYNIAILQKLNVDSIEIVTGFNTQKVEDHVRKYSKVNCVYNPFWSTCNVLGSLYIALQKINDDFLFLHADTLVEYSVWEKLMHASGDIVMPYKKKECGEEEMKVVIDAAGRLVEINKTMEGTAADGEFLGIAKFSSSIIPFITKASKELFMTNNLDFYMEAVVQIAINKQLDVRAYDIQDADFIEVDFEADYLLAKQMFKVPVI